MGSEFPMRAVLHSREEWEKFWSRTALGCEGPAPFADFDFRDSSLVIIDGGANGSLATRLVVRSAAAGAQHQIIDVQLSMVEGCVTTLEIRPMLVIFSARRLWGAPVFHDVATVFECEPLVPRVRRPPKARPLSPTE